VRCGFFFEGVYTYFFFFDVTRKVLAVVEFFAVEVFVAAAFGL
jgi:hypothetical protein